MGWRAFNKGIIYLFVSFFPEQYTTFDFEITKCMYNSQ